MSLDEFHLDKMGSPIPTWTNMRQSPICPKWNVGLMWFLPFTKTTIHSCTLKKISLLSQTNSAHKQTDPGNSRQHHYISKNMNIRSLILQTTMGDQKQIGEKYNTLLFDSNNTEETNLRRETSHSLLFPFFIFLVNMSFFFLCFSNWCLGEEWFCSSLRNSGCICVCVCDWNLGILTWDL